MKTINLVTFILLVFSITTFAEPDKKEQKAKKQLEMAKLIEKGRFCFVPNSANSSVGNITEILPGYDLIFDSIRVISTLPYYGKSYASYYDLTNGIQFAIDSPNIKKTYSESKKKYTFSVNLRDDPATYNINLVAGLDGFATLKIYFANNELITYYGTIEPITNK